MTEKLTTYDQVEDLTTDDAVADQPKSRPDYWNRKLDGNMVRDARHWLYAVL